MVRHAYSTRKQLAWLADETEVQTLGLPDRPAGNSQQGGLGVKGLRRCDVLMTPIHRRNSVCSGCTEN